jgi:outer membrane protein OmpA-like peptidoglycan-associated protein
MKKFLPIISIFCFLGMNAQDFLGLQSSNYAGVTGVYSNPANIVDNRMKFDLSLVGLNLNVDNSYFGIKRKALKYTGKLTDPESIKFPDSWNNLDKNSPDYYKNNYRSVNNGKDKSGIVSTRIVLPSFMITLNKKNAIAFTWSVRNYFNVDNVSQTVANISFDEFVNPSIFLNKFSNKNLSVQQMAWAEYGLSYARVIKDNNQHFFKAGGTVKLLQGLEAAYLYIRDLRYQVDNVDTMSFFDVDVAYGHSDNLNITNTNDVKYQFTSSPGFGLDLGGVYEWRPDYEKYKYDMDNKTDLWRKDQNKYKLKASFAIVDIGGIRYNKGNNSNDFHANVDRFDLDNFKNVDDVISLDSTFKAHFAERKNKSTFTMSLPTAINAQLDYHIWKPFYVNLTTYISNLFQRTESKVHESTNISIAPRFDHKWFGVTVPVSYNSIAAARDDYALVGAMVRLGPFILGSNDVFNYINKDVFGASLYFLLKVPIPYKRPRDRDHDKVSDKKDKCRDVPGVWEFMGCPDKDGDHIPDSEDKCPEVPGIAEMQGCPDLDGDGITDAEDACPDVKGTPEFKGCPDRDGDKIIDKDDECPDEAGLAEFNGCPDKDADGTPDKMDLCPDVFGPKESKGCPDKDGDGLLDKDDECPEEAGPVENKGCPWRDTDKDGVLDKDDVCPTVPGVAEYKGCPPPPPMKEAEQKIIEKAFASLEFATAKDVIKPKSFPSLNALAKLLVQHSNDWTLKLSGHTDNEGSAEKNMVLSEKRANAVKAYLVKKGVKPEKVLTEWFGQTQPIADNTTPAGRQKNRRVEMKIIYKQ